MWWRLEGYRSLGDRLKSYVTDSDAIKEVFGR